LLPFAPTLAVEIGGLIVLVFWLVVIFGSILKKVAGSAGGGHQLPRRPPAGPPQLPPRGPAQMRGPQQQPARPTDQDLQQFLRQLARGAKIGGAAPKAPAPRPRPTRQPLPPAAARRPQPPSAEPAAGELTRPRLSDTPQENFETIHIGREGRSSQAPEVVPSVGTPERLLKPRQGAAREAPLLAARRLAPEGAAGFQDAFAFVMLVLVLLLRPAGLLGKKRTEGV